MSGFRKIQEISGKAGGVGRNPEEAEMSAIGEALERYAALALELPKKKLSELKNQNILRIEEFSLFDKKQRENADFPFNNLYSDNNTYTNVFSLYDNAEYWVPIELVTLSLEYSQVFSTSSGIAAGTSPYKALLRGLQEIIERDALMITWLHSIPGRQIKMEEKYCKEVRIKGGSVICIDATPNYSPFPVALVAGFLPVRGNPRFSLGCACRENWDEAVEKAYLEWVQGVIFAGFYYSTNPDLNYGSYDTVNSFDDHAVYYTVYPDEWNKIPLFKGKLVNKIPHRTFKNNSSTDILSRTLKHLRKEKIRFFYRDLTTKDLKQIGVYSLRVLSPDLTPIFCHQKYPFLGGKTEDVNWRYPWAEKLKLKYPNKMPHPLG